MRKTLICSLLIILMLSTCACGHEHNWTGGTCITPRKCSLCDKTSNLRSDHQFTDATCTTPKTCTVCNITEGTTLEHDYAPATCTMPITCTNCNKTVDEPLGHNYEEGFCTRCQEEDPNYFNADNYGFYNSGEMTKWIEITEYSFPNQSATYAEYGKQHRIWEFKNNLFNMYNRFESHTDNHKEFNNITQSHSYSIVNNDAINVEGHTLTIYERKTDSNGHLIIKAMYKNTKKWFVLYEQIDWDKSPNIGDIENAPAWNSYTYYFK